MQNVGQLILTILKVFPKEWGTVAEIHETDNLRFVLVFEDKPWNWSARWGIAQALNLFVRRNTLQLVCQDGAWGYICTDQLRSQPIKEIREEIALKVFKDLKISPGELCSVLNPDKPFLLSGVEDKGLHEKAGKLWKQMPLEYDPSTRLFRSKKQRKMDKFLMLEQDRAIAIVNNLLQRMDTHKVPAAALICCSNLPILVCDILESRNVSYARIIPNETGLDNKEDYVRLSQGGRSILEDVLSKVPYDLKWPADGDWEKMSIKQSYDFETKFEQGEDLQQLMPKINTIFSSTYFRRLSLEGKRQVIQQDFKNLPFSMLKQVLPEAELEEIFQANARYLGLEELLSNQKFEQLPDFEENIADLVTRLPDDDLQKLQGSSKVISGTKEALTRHIEGRKTRTEELVRGLSVVEFGNDPEFDQKMAKITDHLNQELFGELIESPTVIPKVKQELLKQILIPSLKNSVESQIKKSVKPKMLGLGLLGLVCVGIGVVFGFDATVRWYPLFVTGLFFVEAGYCFIVKRRRMAVSCLVFGVGVLGGYYIYGRWGMLIGMLVAFIATWIIRPNKDDEQMNNLRSLRNILSGTDEDHNEK